MDANVFQKHGEFWTVAFAGRWIRIPDRKGPRYIARLLARPGEEIDVLALSGMAVSGPAPPPAAGESVDRVRKAVANRLRETIARIADVHPDLGAHLLESLRTGRFCSYAPRRMTRWEL
ncbi:MAG: hypothetical protein ACREQY_12780 [Candidatus Binatia bacterium]